MLADVGLTRPAIEGFVRKRMTSSDADVRKMIQPRFDDPKWWYWLATAIMLFEYLVGGSRLAMSAAIGLTAVQLFHFAVREETLTAFPVQVRAAYLGLLVVGLLPWMSFIHWIQLFGTWAMVLFSYCPLARMLSVLPWNRHHPLSFDLLRRTFLSRPVRGSIVSAIRPSGL